MANEFVLDTYAIVALLHHEPGRARTREVLDQAQQGDCVCRASQISLGEVIYTVERRAGLRAVSDFLTTLDGGAITVEDVSWRRIQAAAHIKAQHPVSYADAFAVALAQEYQATILTGDPEFRTVEHLVHVEWISRR